MLRFWIAVGLLTLALVWFFLFPTVLLLAAAAILAGGAWVWWEVRQLRKAARAPRRRR